MNGWNLPLAAINDAAKSNNRCANSNSLGDRSERRWVFGVAILGRRHPEHFFECTVERRNRAVTHIERNRENRKRLRLRSPQPATCIAEAVSVQEVIEVSEPEPLVDQATQGMFL